MAASASVVPPMPQQEPIGGNAPVEQAPKKKKKKVIFDKSTGPWEAIFTERGFLIDDTRLSFEELEDAISKNYSIVLKDGKGIALDAVKMQKNIKV